MKKIICIVAFASMFVGCGKTEPVQTVDWYKNHNQERNAMNKKCDDNPGELAETPNCQNAKEAQSQITWSSRKF